MTDEERRTVIITSVLLLVSSLLRFAWDARSAPPILPAAAVPPELVAETKAAVENEARMATPLAPGERLDPNRAPDVELARLPGVGPALARRIVQHREEAGPFRSPSDLLEVTGIGSATLSRIEPLLDLSSTTAPPRPTAAASPRGDLLDLNRAGEAELQALPGIGPALAGRIVQHRAQVGRFQRVDDLLEVSGIGSATLERLRPFIRLGP